MNVKLEFFDAHGSVWETCSCDHPEAQAFGPEGCARRIPEGPTWREARAAGRIKVLGEWDTLMPTLDGREEHDETADIVADAVAHERAAVVAWLRRTADDAETTGAEMRLFHRQARAIERGDHRREEK